MESLIHVYRNKIGNEKKEEERWGGKDREVLEVEWVLGSDMLGEEGHILLKQTLQTPPPLHHPPMTKTRRSEINSALTDRSEYTPFSLPFPSSSTIAR